jgi:hypothetical protein
MNEPIIRKGLKPKRSSTALAIGHSDRKALPADEQEFERDRNEPVALVFTAKKTKKEGAQAQDKNVKRVNEKNAKDPELDHTIPADYRAKNTPPVEPGKADNEKD